VSLKTVDAIKSVLYVLLRIDHAVLSNEEKSSEKRFFNSSHKADTLAAESLAHIPAPSVREG
jgi:hypothetical protein